MFTAKEKTVIYEAFDLYYKEYCKNLPTKEELSYIEIPNKLEEKMQKLIARERKFYYYWINTVGKRVAAIILAVLISLTTVTFSVRALREPFIKFIVETFEKFSNVVFVNDKSEEDTIIDFTFERVDPAYIPKGYAFESEFEDVIIYKKVYANSDKTSTIMYTQLINDESVVQANTENVTYENIEINGYPAVSYSNKGTNTVILNTEKYVFTIEGAIDKDELVKIVESIEIK